MAKSGRVETQEKTLNEWIEEVSVSLQKEDGSL